MIVRVLFFCILHCLLNIANLYADDFCNNPSDASGQCYPAYDFGYVSSTNSLKVDAADNYWVSFPNPVYSVGKKTTASDADNLVFSISGSWKPWGDFSTQGRVCSLVACTSSDNNCLIEGKKVDEGVRQNNLPCCMNGGNGLYGLIAKESSPGNYPDPNNNNVALINLDNAEFSTFRIMNLKQQSLNNNAYNTFSLADVEIYSAAENRYVKSAIPRGKIYFMIYDDVRKYNLGYYRVSVLNGGYSHKVGIIGRMMSFFQDTLRDAANEMFSKSLQERMFGKIVMILLYIFLLFNVIGFLIGLTPINQVELIKRIFKFSIGLMLLSNTSAEVIRDLFEAFASAAENLGLLMMKSSMYDPQTGEILVPTTDMNNPFAIFDDILSTVVSAAFNAKVWASLFTSKFYLVPAIYFCLAILFIGLWKAIVQYLLAFFLIAILIFTLPIFLLTILFTKTIDLWENWLKQFIASCLLLLILTVAIALLLSFVLDKLKNLLFFPVCWKVIWEASIINIPILKLPFWDPESWSQFDQAMTPGNFFYFFIACMLFRIYMEFIPQLVDAIGKVVRTPITDMLHGMEGSFANVQDQFLENKYVKMAVSSVGGVLRQIHPLGMVDTVITSSASRVARRSAMIDTNQLQKLDQSVLRNNRISGDDYVKKLADAGLKNGKLILVEDFVNAMHPTGTHNELEALMKKHGLQAGGAIKLGNIEQLFLDRSAYNADLKDVFKTRQQLFEHMLKEGKVLDKNEFANYGLRRGSISEGLHKVVRGYDDDNDLSIVKGLGYLKDSWHGLTSYREEDKSARDRKLMQEAQSAKAALDAAHSDAKKIGELRNQYEGRLEEKRVNLNSSYKGLEGEKDKLTQMQNDLRAKEERLNSINETLQQKKDNLTVREQEWNQHQESFKSAKPEEFQRLIDEEPNIVNKIDAARQELDQAQKDYNQAEEQRSALQAEKIKIAEQEQAYQAAIERFNAERDNWYQAADEQAIFRREQELASQISALETIEQRMQQGQDADFAGALTDYERTKANAIIWDTSAFAVTDEKQPVQQTQQEVMAEINEQIKEIKEQEKKFKDIVERVETIKKSKN